MIALAQDVDLETWSSFRTPCTAELAVTVRAVHELQEVLERCNRLSLPTTILGGGTNVVLSRYIGGCVIRVAVRGHSLHDEGERVLVTAGAGESWHGLVRRCVGAGLSGIENLALIPGTVGAAPIQNIGAYGVELASALREVHVIDRSTGVERSLSAGECELGYRDSAFKRGFGNRFVITSIALELRRRFEPVLGYPDIARELARMGVRPTPATVAEAVIRVRRRKLPDPRVVGNAGSFFKNPVLHGAVATRVTSALLHVPVRPIGDGVRFPAAALIEACGLKGARKGRAAVWFRQPLVLVNTGGATADDLLALAGDIRARVADRFGVVLELEPAVIGDARAA